MLTPVTGTGTVKVMCFASEALPFGVAVTVAVPAAFAVTVTLCPAGRPFSAEISVISATESSEIIQSTVLSVALDGSMVTVTSVDLLLLSLRSKSSASLSSENPLTPVLRTLTTQETLYPPSFVRAVSVASPTPTAVTEIRVPLPLRSSIFTISSSSSLLLHSIAVFAASSGDTVGSMVSTSSTSMER